MHRIAAIASVILGLVLLISWLPLSSEVSAQQTCTDQNIYGTAASKDRIEALRNADLAWGKEAGAKLQAKTTYHRNPSARCVAKGRPAEYTCTVSAKACASPPVIKGRRASSCWPHGECEICCEGPNGRMSCHAQCM